ncbi:hypothetical protein [Paraburkholderia xenovorans]|jgi:hypothetical protein
MPVPVSPMKLTCRGCGRHRVYPQRSDALILPSACESCGGTDLEIRPALPLDGPGALATWLLDRVTGRSRMRR